MLCAVGCGSLVAAAVVRAGVSCAIAMCIKPIAAAAVESGWLLDWESLAGSRYVRWR